MRRALRIGYAALLLLVSGGVLAQGQEVTDGEVLNLSIPDVDDGTAVISQDFFIDLPADARALEIRLTTSSSRDIDILAKVNVPIDPDAPNLFDDSDFSSGGAAGDEFVIIADYATAELGGQRWFFNMFSFPGTGGTARMEVDVHFGEPPNVDIEVDFANALGEDNCDVAPLVGRRVSQRGWRKLWHDARPAASQRGQRSGSPHRARPAELRAPARSRVLGKPR